MTHLRCFGQRSVKLFFLSLVWAKCNCSYSLWQLRRQRLSHTLMIHFSLRTLPSWKKAEQFLQVKGVSSGIMYKTNSEKSKIVLIFKVLVECRFNFIREKYLLIASSCFINYSTCGLHSNLQQQLACKYSWCIFCWWHPSGWGKWGIKKRGAAVLAATSPADFRWCWWFNECLTASGIREFVNVCFLI